MKKCKFNVGDEVVLNQNYDGFKAGTQAVVTDTDGDLVFWKTKTGKKSSCFEHRLNLVGKTSKPECKFKPGDRVVLNRDLEKCRKGATGTVKSFGYYNATLKTHMVYVTLDDKRTLGTYERYFDLVTETPKCKFEVGDRVKANEKSNGRYFSTNLHNNFTGVVTDIKSYGRVDIRRDSDGYVWHDLEPEYFDLIESTPEIHITVKGNETIAVYKNGTETKEAVAKCSPEDTFDFGVGAKLALERLGVLPTEKKEEPITVGGFKIGDRVNFNGVNGTVICFDEGDYIGVEFDKPTDVNYDCGGIKLKAGTTGTKHTSRWLKAKDLTPGEVPQYYNGKVVCTMSTRPGFTAGKIYTFVDGAVRDDDGDLRYDTPYLRVKHPSEIINLWNFIPLVE